MQKMVTEIKAATQPKTGSKRNRYEYDSDEETEGGTWEHKSRTKEMCRTEGVHYGRCPVLPLCVVCVCVCVCV